MKSIKTYLREKNVLCDIPNLIGISEILKPAFEINFSIINNPFIIVCECRKFKSLFIIRKLELNRIELNVASLNILFEDYSIDKKTQKKLE